MKCFAVTLPWMDEASCIRRGPMEPADVFIYGRKSKNDVQLGSVLCTIIITPVYLNPENILSPSKPRLRWKWLAFFTRHPPIPADQMNRTAISQCSSGEVTWTNVCSKILFKKIKWRGKFNAEAQQFCQALSCKQPWRKKLRRREWVDACCLLQGNSEAEEETTDQAKDCCVLTSFPGESGPRYYLGIEWKLASTWHSSLGIECFSYSKLFNVSPRSLVR